MRVCENFGRTSAPFLPQHVQVKLGSMSESQTSSTQPFSVGFDMAAAAVIAPIDQDVADAGRAHFAKGDFLSEHSPLTASPA